MTACTPGPTTAAPGFRCRSCGGWREHSGDRQLAPRFFGAPTNRSHRVTIETDAPKSSRAAGRQRRCRRAGSKLPGLPPDHQPGRPASRGERHRHRRDGLRQGYRRTCRGAAVPVLPIFRSAIQRASRTIPRRRPLPWSWPCGCWKPPRVRRPRCNRRCAGARTRRGSATTATPGALSAEELARLRREFDAQKEIARGLRESAA